MNSHTPSLKAPQDELRAQGSFPVLGPEGLRLHQGNKGKVGLIRGCRRCAGVHPTEGFLGIKGVGGPGWEATAVIQKWIFSEPKSVQDAPPRPPRWPWAGRGHSFR